MQLIPLNFERELNFTRSGITQKGRLVISQIEYQEDRDAWACYWSLDFIKPYASRVYGADPLDSLLSALWAASDVIRESGIPELQVWWQQVGDNGGLQEIYRLEQIGQRRAPPRRNA
jgi:hypothetical protein